MAWVLHGQPVRLRQQLKSRKLAQLNWDGRESESNSLKSDLYNVLDVGILDISE